MKENDREKFKRLAERRVNKIIKTFRLLGNLSNQSNYNYAKEDVHKIFGALNNELKICKDRFKDLRVKSKGDFTL